MVIARQNISIAELKHQAGFATEFTVIIYAKSKYFSEPPR